MKKGIILIAIIAIAGTASAILLEDFNAGNTAALSKQTSYRNNTSANYAFSDSQSNPSYQTTGGVTNSGYLKVLDGFSGYGGVGRWYDVAALGLSTGVDYRIDLMYAVFEEGTVDGNNSGLPDFLNIIVATDNGSAAFSSRIEMNEGMEAPGGSDIEVVTQIGTNLNATAWTSASSGSFQIDSSDTYVFVGVEGQGFGGNAGNPTTDYDYFGLDNIELNVVPEPATVGMLGLGALVSIFVRRVRRT